MQDVQVLKIYPDALIPQYANPGDAGADLYSYVSVDIMPNTRFLIDTGVAFAMPEGWVGLIHPRSGMAARHGVTVLNAPGTVDSGYRGIVMVNLINHGTTPFRINKGDRIAQIVFQKFEPANFVLVNSLNTTNRGEDGHGSTGMGIIDAGI